MAKITTEDRLARILAMVPWVVAHDGPSIKETCKRINKLESKADEVFDKAVADIFENETDAKNIIKYKEVLSSLEAASDKCKSVSNVMEQISVKHS